jgi:hypothetical protein
VEVVLEMTDSTLTALCEDLRALQDSVRVSTDDQFSRRLQRLDGSLVRFHTLQEDLQRHVSPRASWDQWKPLALATAWRTSAQLALDFAHDRQMVAADEARAALSGSLDLAQNAALALLAQARAPGAPTAPRVQGLSRRSSWGGIVPSLDGTDLASACRWLDSLEPLLAVAVSRAAVLEVLGALPHALTVLTEAQDDIWIRIGDDVPWRWYSYLVRAEGWRAAAEMAVEYACENAHPSANAVHPAVRSAVAFSREASTELERLSHRLRGENLTFAGSR